jgi:YegS C-terminal NAD kinase beta sandwich-like domain
VIRRGEQWGNEPTGAPDVRVDGDDAALAAIVGRHRGDLIGFVPDASSDIARALGLAPKAPAGTTEVPLDAIELGDGATVSNAAVLGVAPDRLAPWHRRRAVRVEVDGRTVFDGRASTIVVATGQFLRGADLVPRGHPGDGRVEVQVYALDPAQRGPMRRRLAAATHVPHPDITEAAGGHIGIVAERPWPLELDGHATAPRARLSLAVVPGAYRLLV